MNLQDILYDKCNKTWLLNKSNKGIFYHSITVSVFFIYSSIRHINNIAYDPCFNHSKENNRLGVF